MVDNFRVVTGGPVGRKRYFEIQVNYLLKLRHIIDEHYFWINTDKKEDLEYFDSLIEQYPDFFKKVVLEYEPLIGYSTQNVHRFYCLFNDPNTVYCKIDDDIVFMETDAFEGFIRHRIENPQYFLTFANTLNNPLNHFVLQRIGAISVRNFPAVTYDSTNHAWSDFRYAMSAFYHFETYRKENNLGKLKFKEWVLAGYERHSINFMCWLGSEFAKFDKVGIQDEPWLSEVKPAEREMPNCIYGGFLVVHYAFNTQREKLDAQPEVLSYFKKLSEMN